MVRGRRSYWVTLLALAFAGVAQAVGVGDPAPDFELMDTEGNTHMLSQYRGSVVFINFFGYS